MQHDAISVKAYGKVNLSLEVTGRREDGYHTLCSVMQSVSLFNKVSVKKSDKSGILLRCNDPLLPLDEKNTAFRAAKRFFEYTGLKDGVEIEVIKNVPYQAGLGSASADAAGVLACLNKLYPDIMTQKELLGVALGVGADVPFCLIGGTMLAKGIGEELYQLPKLPQAHMLIVWPQKGVSTKEAYDKLDEVEYKPVYDENSMISALNSGKIECVAKNLYNAFEKHCPVSDVAQIKKELIDSGALGASMSGSGTAVFGIYADETALLNAREKISVNNRKTALAIPKPVGVEFE